jgi:hypothetical protein
MKKLLVFALAVLSLTSCLIAADDFGIKFSGFVKTDLMYDSRQTVAARHGHFLLYPAGPNEDADGNDLSEKASLNILAIQTRLKGSITGPDAFGAKTSGLIEGAFFGQSEGDINGFRLRHAFLTLKWETTSLLMGQFWHPMFVTDCFPGTVSFNTGAPFQPFSRNPQIRLTKTAGSLSFIAAAMSQLDFTSTGPDGASTKYIRNAVIPNLHGQIQAKTKAYVVGAGVDWKSLAPYWTHSETHKINSLSFLGYARFNLPNLVWKMEGVYGENLTDHLMLGGYGFNVKPDAPAVSSLTPTKVFSAWTDLSTNGKTSLGCFAGYTKNLGASKDLDATFMRGSNMEAIFRVSPRISWNSGSTRFSTEVEYTAASYGETQADATVEKAEFVGNLRILVAAYYFF